VSTRAIIAWGRLEDWVGRYHHLDGYPAGLGKGLWNAYHGPFGKNLEAMRKVLFLDHLAGWSNIIDADWALEPGWVDWVAEQERDNRPRCYCHGGRRETEQTLASGGTDFAGAEWCYVLDIGAKTMAVLERMEGGSHAFTFFGIDPRIADWRLCEVVALDGPEPDWESIKWKGRIMDRLPERLTYHAAGYGVAFRVWGAEFGGVEIVGGLPLLVPRPGRPDPIEEFGRGVALLAGTQAEAFAFGDAVYEDLRERSASMAMYHARVLAGEPEEGHVDTLTVFDAMGVIARVLVQGHHEAIVMVAHALQNGPGYLTMEDIDALLAEEPGGEGEDEPADEEEG